MHSEAAVGGCGDGEESIWAEATCSKFFEGREGARVGALGVGQFGVGQFGVGQLGHNYSYVVIYGFWRALVLKCR